MKDELAEKIYFPHIESEGNWWTGIVVQNPGLVDSQLSLLPYDKSGNPLTGQSLILNPGEKFATVVEHLNLPQGTAWLSLESSEPLTGFELFGTKDGKQLAGYTGVGISGKSGVFPKKERAGWTGLAFINVEESPALVAITAYEDSGEAVSVANLNLNPHEKRVALAPEMFSQNIETATFLGYESDKILVGFQLNGSENSMMLDGLPALR